MPAYDAPIGTVREKGAKREEGRREVSREAKRGKAEHDMCSHDSVNKLSCRLMFWPFALLYII